MKPFFSIVIPLYNKSNVVETTINSVLKQSFSDFEILIINDGSTDTSLETAKSIKDKRLRIFTTKNQGVSAARNFGIKQAQADYIAFIDADDYWESTFLEIIHQTIQENSMHHVFSTAAKIKKGLKIISLKYVVKPQKKVTIFNFFEASQVFPILHPSTLVISKYVIDSIGFFDENLSTTEDTDYWIRIGMKFKVVFFNSSLVTIRITKNGLTGSNRSYYKSLNYSKYFKYCDETPFLKEFLNKNMYSSAIKYKLIGDTENYRNLLTEINPRMLNKKQNIILLLPRDLLRLAISFYRLFNKGKNFY